jgi:hypothetical protein
MAHCYGRAGTGVHPPSSQAECALGLVRGTPRLQVTHCCSGLNLLCMMNGCLTGCTQVAVPLLCWPLVVVLRCAGEDGTAQCALHVPALPHCYYVQIVTVSHSCSILQAVCVDGGMYLGARAYLEIGSDGHFRAFEKYRGSPNSAQYNTFHPTDLTEITCKGQL